MEAVSGSAFKSQLITHTPTSRELSANTRIHRSVAVRTCCGSINGVDRFKRSCVVGLAREGSDGGVDKVKQNGFALLSEESFSVFQVG